MPKAKIGGAFLIFGIILFAYWKGHVMKQPIDLLRVRFGIFTEITDPSKIDSAQDWYFMGHISSGLIAFDHEKEKFRPFLASWNSHASGVHQFILKDSARFHDGTPIRAADVVASIKRLIIKRSSTHFPLWEYLEGCESVTQLSDSCPGITAVNSNTVEFRLKQKSSSFLLQVSSPETGIWSEEDIVNAEASGTFRPTKFSGPYYVESQSAEGFLLKKNEFNPLTSEFELSPRRILINTTREKVPNEQLLAGQVDLVARAYLAYIEPDWEKIGFPFRKSSPCDTYYFYGTTDEGQSLIGGDFVKALWADNTEPELHPAETFLPFGRGYSLTDKEILATLPEHSAKKIRIAVPGTYFPDQVLKLFTESGRRVGIEFEITRYDRNEWFALFSDRNAKAKTDFILSIYAASERYPAVQLRALTGPWRRMPIDLKQAEIPDLTPEQKQLLIDYQRILLQRQHAIPLFFAPMMMVYRPDIDIGNQPPIDAEIELWRVTRK